MRLFLLGQNSRFNNIKINPIMGENHLQTSLLYSILLLKV